MDAPWIIVGCGRLGRALGVAANREGIVLRATWNRTPDRAAESKEILAPARAMSGGLPEALSGVDFTGAVVWLTVVDDAVADVAEACAGLLDDAALVLHAAGALDAGVLEAAGIGAPTGSLHPLLAVSDPESGADRFGEVAWSVEGADEARAFGRAFADRFGARLVELGEGTRPRYHASAATAANLLVALADSAFEMAEGAELSRDEAREILLPLMESALENLRERPADEALTGPVARGDDGTVERHLAALEEAPALRELYRVLTSRARELVSDEHEE